MTDQPGQEPLDPKDVIIDRLGRQIGMQAVMLAELQVALQAAQQHISQSQGTESSGAETANGRS